MDRFEKKRRKWLEAANHQDLWEREFRLQVCQLTENSCHINPLRSLDDNFATFMATVQGMADGSCSQELDALVEAIEKVPQTLGRIKADCKSDVKEVRQFQECQVKVVNALIELCHLGLYWVTQKPHGRPLEAAIFFRFSQVYKGWQLSDKLAGTFWHKLEQMAKT